MFIEMGFDHQRARKLALISQAGDEEITPQKELDLSKSSYNIVGKPVHVARN